MRVSVDKNDITGFENYKKFGPKIKVFLNGEKVDDCVIADNLEGYVVKYKRDDSGNHVLNNDKTALQREILDGDVSIDVTLGY